MLVCLKVSTFIVQISSFQCVSLMMKTFSFFPRRARYIRTFTTFMSEETRQKHIFLYRYCKFDTKKEIKQNPFFIKQQKIYTSAGVRVLKDFGLRVVLGVRVHPAPFSCPTPRQGNASWQQVRGEQRGQVSVHYNHQVKYTMLTLRKHYIFNKFDIYQPKTQLRLKLLDFG